MNRTTYFYRHLTLERALATIEEWHKPATYAEQLTAWQWMVDTGYCWRGQGWRGRWAEDLLTQGLIDYAENEEAEL